jgi:hypothetical protein
VLRVRPGFSVADAQQHVPTIEFFRTFGGEGVEEKAVKSLEYRLGPAMGLSTAWLTLRPFRTSYRSVPPGDVAALHVDRDGRLWLGSSVSGLICIEDPTADAPRFVTYGGSYPNPSLQAITH